MTAKYIESYGKTSKKDALKIANNIRNQLRKSLEVGNLFVEIEVYRLKSKIAEYQIKFYDNKVLETVNTDTGEIFARFNGKTIQEVENLAKKNQSSFKPLNQK